MYYTDDELIRIFNRSDGCCLYCGRQLSFYAYRDFCHRGTWVVDLFLPIEAGGQDQIFNWVAACPACSYEKGPRTPWEFNPERFQEGVRDPEKDLAAE